MPAAASSKFEFTPVNRSDDDDDDATLEPKERYEFGSSTTNDSTPTSSVAASVSKKKKHDGQAAIRALRQGREKKGLRVSSQHHAQNHAAAEDGAVEAQRKSSPPNHSRMNSPDPPTAADVGVARGGAAAAGRRSNRGRSTDPPAQRSTAPAKAPSASTTACTAKSIEPPTSSNGSNALKNESLADTGSFAKGNSPRNVSLSVDVPKGKMPAAAVRPSPPGRNADWKDQSGVTVPAPAAAPAPTAPVPAAAMAPTAPATPVDKGLLNAAISRATYLLSSSAATNQKRREEMGIRGNVSVVQQTVSDPTVQRTEQTLGVPPRNAMLTEAQMDDVNATLDNGKGETGGGERGRGRDRDGEHSQRSRSVDPPMVEASIPYKNTLQRFREVGNPGAAGATPPPVSIKREDGSPANSTAVAVGERTLEVGEKEDVKPHTASVVADMPVDNQLTSSFVKSICKVTMFVMKVTMFVQMALGLLYLVNNDTNHLPSFNWNHYIPSVETIMQSFRQTAVMDMVPTPVKETAMLPSCFINHPSDFEDDTEEFPDVECEGVYKQCPHWGICQAGELVDCTDGEQFLLGKVHRFQINEAGDACEVSLEVKELNAIVQELLATMSTAQTCKLSDRVTEAEDVSYEDPFPLFRLETVAENLRHAAAEDGDVRQQSMSSEVLLWLLPTFDSTVVRFGSLSGNHDWDDLDAMGLGPGVSPNSLSLPLACTAKLLLLELLQFIATSTLALLLFSTKTIWLSFTIYPIYSFGAVALMKLVSMIRRKRKHNAAVRELFGPVLNAAYDRLSECDDGDGYAALHLRDEVGHDMYPMSFQQRDFIARYVWPRVTLEMHADNRVRKYRRVVGGKELEHWDFAIQSKKGRRLRNSLGAGSTPGTADQKVNGVVHSPKRSRDP